MHRIKAVEPLKGHKLKLWFEDGTVKEVNLSYLRQAKNTLESLRDEAYFAKVSIDQDAKTVCWPNGVDLCPDTLYEDGIDVN